MRPHSRSEMELLHATLQEVTGIKPECTQDALDNYFVWLRLPRPVMITVVAKALAGIEARLATITAYSESRKDPHDSRAMAYHFVLGGVMCTVTVPLYNQLARKISAVSSIVSWFANADWPERECVEMFGIELSDHPNPERLFLDERLKSGIMTRLIPFSSMMHGAGSSDLWERVMETKHAGDLESDQAGQDVPPAPPASEAGLVGDANPVATAARQAAAQADKVTEPEFTPVSATENLHVPLESVSNGQNGEGGQA